MKDYRRPYPLFSLCGLPCGLCPIHHMENGCPGCGGGAGNQPCAIIRCSLQHGGVEFCNLCAAFPCERFDSADGYDYFLPGGCRVRELRRAEAVGPDAYRAELEERMAILRRLLEGYNDGRRKSFFCVAADLLDLSELRAAMAELAAAPPVSLKERGALAAQRLQAAADRQGVSLKLRRKPKK